MMRISEEAIEKRANYVRGKIGLGDIIAPNMYIALQQLASKAKSFSFRPALISEMGGDEAVMDIDNDVLMVRESVLEDAKSGQNRARFTIAHEIGHYFLGHDGAPRRNPDKSVYASAKDRIQESEANMFASYLLVPTALALDCPTAEHVSIKFQVSGEVADIAFERIQREKRKATGSKRPLPASVIDFLAEKSRRVPSSTTSSS